ncbi:uncharacterized protein ATNIH1004_011700 [Aspergillus tanneri]|uniref:Uncharacterized protein n=1 Tax=Aspergillus tanneri TaxID=1220188 RepID=A0A5M9M891_9EURO|nr:uncharacterized protein ATNIH1004_011700 [Aspergillus tanneri]KAA8641564.1 hypothetical protein ATNIH1004_011700 [Aspergillus tanneri]
MEVTQRWLTLHETLRTLAAQTSFKDDFYSYLDGTGWQTRMLRQLEPLHWVAYHLDPARVPGKLDESARRHIEGALRPLQSEDGRSTAWHEFLAFRQRTAERAFSQMNLQHTKIRNRLESHRVEKLLYIQINKRQFRADSPPTVTQEMLLEEEDQEIERILQRKQVQDYLLEVLDTSDSEEDIPPDPVPNPVPNPAPEPASNPALIAVLTYRGSQAIMANPFSPEKLLHMNVPTWDAPTPGVSTEHQPHLRTLARLPLLGLDDWEEERAYDEQPPICIHYSIEWKLALNKRVVVSDTEQNLVLAPSAYWDKFLNPKLERVVGQKFSRDQRVRPDDTAITVAINDRSEHNLTKRFEKTNINWSLVEDQLLDWGDLFRAGKKLRLIITFYYLGDSRSCQKKGDKRGSSATQRMQVEKEDQLNAERTSGLSSSWRQVYQLMRCRDKACKQGVHCFEDPVSQKHFPLTQHHLSSLIDFVNGGGILRTENDIPDWFHEQLKAEEKVLKTKSKDKGSLAHGGTCSPINIVLPAQALSSIPATTQAAVPDTPPSSTSRCKRLDIAGPRDVAVRNYSEWHASKVDDYDLKNDYRKACQVALKNGLDLQQILNRPDPNFFS